MVFFKENAHPEQFRLFRPNSPKSPPRRPSVAPCCPSWVPLGLILAPTWSQLGPTRPQVGASKCPLAAPSWLKSPPESPQRAQKLARRPPRSPKLPRGPYFARFWTLWDPILRASGCFLVLLGALDLEADLWQKTQQTHLQGPPPAYNFFFFFEGHRAVVAVAT